MNAEQPAAPFLGDHLALDFLNTRFRSGDDTVDCIDGPAKLEDWLSAARSVHPAAFTGLDEAAMTRVTPAVVERALALREWLYRSLCHAASERRRRAGGSIAPVNRILASGKRYIKVVAGSGGFAMQDAVQLEDPEGALLPVAEAIAELLCHDDRSLVRQCDNDACVLWFYDRTKSKRRRWCSMAVCGNQAKVNAFRRRQRSTSRSRKAKSNG